MDVVLENFLKIFSSNVEVTNENSSNVSTLMIQQKL